MTMLRKSWKSRIYVILIGIALGLLALAIKAIVTPGSDQTASSAVSLRC
jgi:hypothetical protein